MWSYLKPRNLLDYQRDAAIRDMGDRARTLLTEGYAADADAILDQLGVRLEAWARGEAA